MDCSRLISNAYLQPVTPSVFTLAPGALAARSRQRRPVPAFWKMWEWGRNWRVSKGMIACSAFVAREAPSITVQDNVNDEG